MNDMKSVEIDIGPLRNYSVGSDSSSLQSDLLSIDSMSSLGMRAARDTEFGDAVERRGDACFPKNLHLVESKPGQPFCVRKLDHFGLGSVDEVTVPNMREKGGFG
jgi:hypothetical protein